MTRSILERVAAGDRTAVEECMERYGNLVWSLARRFLAQRAEAEDAVQEIFIDLWTHAARFRPGLGSEMTFVSTIARRRLIDRLRKQRREPEAAELTELTAVEIPAVQEAVETQDEVARVSKVIATLKPEQQRVLELSVYHGLSHGGIADKLGMPLGTVKTHLRRGLIRIREKLGAHGAGPGQVAS